MRIVDRNTFISLPCPTVYVKILQRWVIDDTLCIKVGNMANDWVYQSFYSPVSDDPSDGLAHCDEMIDNGTSYPIDQEATSRDGCYDDTEMFLVYEKDDICFLIDRLTEAHEQT